MPQAVRWPCPDRLLFAIVCPFRAFWQCPVSRRSSLVQALQPQPLGYLTTLPRAYSGVPYHSRHTVNKCSSR